MTSTNFDKRSYEKIDAAHEQSLRPDFTVLIYPAYLSAAKGRSQLADELPVSKQTPPAFIVMTEDDPLGPQNAMAYFELLPCNGRKFTPNCMSTRAVVTAMGCDLQNTQ